MSLEGNAKAGSNLRGRINGLETLKGYSAYEIALIHGFKGTEEEWLASLKGEKGDNGDNGDGSTKDVYVVRCAYDQYDNPYIIGEFDWGSMEKAYHDGRPVFLQISNAVELDGTYSSDGMVAMHPIYQLDFADEIAFFRDETAIEKVTFTIYNSGRITKTVKSNIDDTLTKNMPANAKAVGDALKSTVKSINGITPDENGNVVIDIGGGGGSAESTEVEELAFSYATSYPNATTFEYTKSANTSRYWVWESETAGGELRIDWDSTQVTNIDCQLFLKDSNGAAYKYTPKANKNGVNANVAFSEDGSNIVWFDPDGGVGYPDAVVPFTVKIPGDCTVLISMRRDEAVFPAGSTISDVNDLAAKARSLFAVTLTREVDKNHNVLFVEQDLTPEQQAQARKNIGAAAEVETETVMTAAVNPNVKSVNHRGYGTAPENTLSAYRLSKQKGFDIVECDVSFTADGVAVLLHDATIDRTSNGTGNIAEMTLEQARQYDYGSWKSAEYIGEKIPTFEEFISLCRNLGLHPYIELKATGLTQENIDGLVLILKKHSMLNNVTWISFAPASLTLVKNVNNRARLGYVVGSIAETHITTAQNLKTEHNEVFVDAYCDDVTENMISMCLEADIPLEYWGLNTAEKVLAANPYVSGFTTDTVVAGVTLYNNAK